MRISTLLLAVTSLLTASVSRAAVILDGLQVLPEGGGCGSWSLWAGPDGSQGYVNLVRTTGAAGCTTDLYSTRPSVGVPHQWYRLGGGVPFGPDAVNLLSPLPLGDPSSRALFAQSINEPWYVAFWIDSSVGYGLSPGPGPGDHFGWAALVVDNTGLRILSQGTDTSGRGIIIGTLTALPEPGTGLCLAPALAATMLRRRRRGNAPV